MFFGREDILQKLDALLGKHVASLVTCRGRRRIGKSTLIERFANNNDARFIKIEGVRPTERTSNEIELRSFAEQLALQTDAESSLPDNWLSAFKRLDHEIKDDVLTVVLLDEISWMGRYDDLFADSIKIAWDNMWKKHDRLVLVLCGSVSSWIKEHIVDSSAFVGRRSCDLVVRELPLKECVKFWGREVERVDLKEIVDVLSVTGGVPRYLEEVNPSLSAEENIRRMAFSHDGVLRNDFDEMFNDVITKQPDFTAKVLHCLVDGPRTAAEVARKLKLCKGGRITDALERLVEAGFVMSDRGKNPETGEELRENRYRMSDNYCRFYLKFVEPAKAVIDRDEYEFAGLDALENVDSVMGLAFENLVVNNYHELVPYLHLKGTVITSAAPYLRRGSNAKRGRKGCQVDLLVQTRKSLCFVEVKRKKEITRAIIDEMNSKISAVKRPDGMSAFVALVYFGSLSPVVAADGYFSAIVPFRKLLGI